MKINSIFFLLLCNTTSTPMQQIQKIKNSEFSKNIAYELREAKTLLPMFIVLNAAYATGTLFVNYKFNEFFERKNFPDGTRAFLNMTVTILYALQAGCMIASAHLNGSRKREMDNQDLIHYCQTRDLHQVKKYLVKGANANCELTIGNCLHTPLLWALRAPNSLHLAASPLFPSNNFDVADLLKKYHVKVNQKHLYNRTLLHMAILDQRNFSRSSINWLLQNGANVDHEDDNGHTALTYASMTSNTDVIQLLLRHGANPNTRNYNGSTPLHAINWYVAYQDDDAQERALQAAILLRMYGAQINARDVFGRTPLFSAISQNLTGLTEYLLYEGADKHSSDRDEYPPEMPSSPKIAQLLHSKEKPSIPAKARSIMLEMATGPQNIASLLSSRERGTRLKRPHL